MRKYLAVGGAFLLAAVALVAWQLLPASGDDYACSMAGSQPTSGTLQLEYLGPSSAANPDRNDYKVSGTVRWDDQQAVDCFAVGTVDWAYEHNITYGEHIDRKIWSEQFGQFAAAEPYIDTTASDFGDHTDLSFGLFRPERLSAGTTYSFSYDTFLPKSPQGGKQWILLQGQVLEKNCSTSGPWCVGLNSHGRGDTTNPPLVGWTRGFAVEGTTCWAWHIGQDPTDCSPPQAASPTPAAPATTAPDDTPPPPTSGAPQAPPTTEAAAPPSQAPPSAPAQTNDEQPTGPNPPAPDPTHAATPATATGVVNGCNTYGENCDNDPIYARVPTAGYDWHTEPKVATVPNGTTLTSRCWALGGRTYNWAASMDDPGPNPYDSDIYFSVQAPDGQWGFIPDTYFVRDKGGKLGLAHC